MLGRRDDLLQPVDPIVYLLRVCRVTQVGVCFEENPGLAGLLGFIHPKILDFFLGQSSERQWDQWITFTVSPEDGSVSCWRSEKLPKTCQTSQSRE